MQEPDYLEINLGKYLEILIRQWALILLIALLFVAIAAGVDRIQPKVYQASVLVASTKITSSVSFGSSIETLSEGQLGTRVVDGNARLQSYVQQVKSPRIAEAVIADLGVQLPETDRDPIRLIGRVNGSQVAKSDSISITVRHSDPKLSAAIANSWAKEYVNQVNTTYLGGGVRDSYLAIKRQAEEARRTYEQAQAEQVEFISENKLNELARQISEQRSVKESLSAARTLMVSEIISTTMLSHLAVYEEQLRNLEKRLALAYNDSRRVNQLLKSAQDMRDQVLNGGSGAASSNALALNLLKAQIFTFNNEEGLGNLQIQVAPLNLSTEEMVTDLDSLIRTLESRQQGLDTEIASLSQKLLENNGSSSLSVNAAESGRPAGAESQATLQAFTDLSGIGGIITVDQGETELEQKIRELELKLNELKSLSAIESGREQELTRAVQLAWETYSNLATKEAELRVAAETMGTEVVLAVPAAAPSKPDSSGSKNLELAGAVGLVIGLIVAFTTEFWWQYKGISPQPVLSLSRRRKRVETQH